MEIDLTSMATATYMATKCCALSPHIRLNRRAVFWPRNAWFQRRPVSDKTQSTVIYVHRIVLPHLIFRIILVATNNKSPE